MDHLALATAVFLGGLVSGFSGFAFSAAAGAISPSSSCSSSQAA
jgi:hypothetical protein